MDSNGCILILILTNWPISRVQWYPMFECFWPIAISCFCCGAQEDVYWASCGQELLTGQRQRAASESDLILLDLWERDQLCTCPTGGSHWGKPPGRTHGWNVGGCWGYPPWWLPAIRMILFWSAQEIHCTMERLLSACSFSSNSLQISGVYTKGHSTVFYFKIEAHLQSQP